MEESPLFHLIKKIKDDWVSSKGIIYQDNIHHRIGDEIQCTALYKFLRSHNITINYKDSNPKISSLTLFPDNLVNYIKEIPYKKKIVDFLNLWSWSPLLASKGFYTEVQHKYNEKNIEYDCVFIPCLLPEYNTKRGISNPQELFYALKNKFKNFICIIDYDKKEFFNIEDSSVVYSQDIYQTFKYIEKCKYFIGCDTGTTHYAGAINHPKMTLLYPDETEMAEILSWHRKAIQYVFDFDEILNFEVSSLPCCRKENYKVITINNEIKPFDLLDNIQW